MQYPAALRFLHSYFPSRLLAVSLFSALLSFPTASWAQCGTCTRTITQNTNGLNIAPGETVCIAAGVTVSGNINWNGTGGAICNSGTIATSFNIPAQGTVYNSPSATINASNVNFNGNGGRIVNDGTLTIGNTNIGSGSEVYNSADANATLSSFNLNGGTITNYGTITSSSGGNLGGLVTNGIGATFTIPASININSGGQLDNLGTFTVSDIRNNATIRNCGTFRQSVANGGFTNNGQGLVSNFGVFDILGDFDNNGDFQGATQGGVGVVRVGRNSRQNGGGRFAVVGRLDFCDATSSNGGQFDNGRGDFGSTTSPGPGLPPQLTFCQYATNSSQIAGCRNSPLPVELTSFEAKLSKGSVLLTWSTASEKNNDKFVVERSANGEVFEALTEVAGHGNSASAHTYSTTDQAPLAGTSYYRLRQIDFDGTTAYSPVATIQNAATAQANKLGIYPNPATDHITLDLPKGIGETYEVRISSVSGKLVRRMTLHGNAPQLDLQALPAGTYLLQVRSASTQLVQRLIKQ